MGLKEEIHNMIVGCFEDHGYEFERQPDTGVSTYWTMFDPIGLGAATVAATEVREFEINP